MEKIVIIGAGASGLAAAITAKSKYNEVILFERNDKCAKKILITGNGKCNYFNENFIKDYFYSENNDLLEKLINKQNISFVKDFFNEIGLFPKIENNCYYPYSKQASSVKEILVKNALKKGVQIRTSTFVRDINKAGDKFLLELDNDQISCDKLIISTGGKSYFKTGSDGNGYELLIKMNHKINKLYPALTGLVCKENIYKNINGVRTEVLLSLYENNNKVKEEYGQLQFTNEGISGICVFNLSGIISKGIIDGKKEVIKINFLPFLRNFNDACDFFEKRSCSLPKTNMEDFFESLFNYKLIPVILKRSNIVKEDLYENLSKKQKKDLIENIIGFDVDIMGTKSYDNAQVTGGGIALSDINLNTMESVKVKNMFVTGELLDVYGICGGYNLGFAFLTGILAGKGVKGND